MKPKKSIAREILDLRFTIVMRVLITYEISSLGNYFAIFSIKTPLMELYCIMMVSGGRSSVTDKSVCDFFADRGILDKRTDEEGTVINRQDFNLAEYVIEF